MTSQNIFASRSSSYSFIYRLIDLSILFLALFAAGYIYSETIGRDFLIAVLIISVIFLYVSESFDLYRPWRIGNFTAMLLSACACICIAFLVAVTLAFLFKQSEGYSRVIVVLWFSLSIILSSLWRILQRQYIVLCHKSGYFIKRVAIIGSTDAGIDLFKEIKKNNDLGYQLLGVYDDRASERVRKELKNDLIGRFEDALYEARKGNIDILFIALPLKAEKRIADILLLLGDTTVDVHFLPNFLISSLIRSRTDHVGNIDTISVYESPYYGSKKWVKRIEDIILSSLILCIIAIPLLFISLMIKVTSPGPILFKQRRYGLGGEEILVWKFRTMSVMENDEKVVQATKNDPRITPLGAFLRRTSLDEFPQFFNVLCGHMSVVGPRPHAVAHNEEFRKKVEFYMLRHKVKPGITGWAQVNGWRGETDTLDKMRNRVDCDLYYIKNWSIWLDIKIIFLTIFKGFTNPNAY
ncbi:undecaprenyl-phosphate glucose phosphotransferase [Psychromonas antarctica]|uniref:undecaprenyl-phosphate glucose phosphotransferase n=1 Tax=Psychromonas antarctica TaxID=67573 RepID=UPI001EE87512|nr:undecaprenyl-phosphate glucose phosphotransferase [Psychromonas antarctica]